MTFRMRIKRINLKPLLNSFKVSQVNLEAACSNQPQNYTILSGKREIEIENCDLEETDQDLKSFLEGEVGLGNSEISKVCADQRSALNAKL